MMVAWRLPGVHVVGVEAQEVSVALARKSQQYNGLSERWEIRPGDFRHESLSPTERFDLITGTPPYFPLDSGVTSEHPQKVACRFEVRGDIASYCEVAARHLAPGATFACVFPIRPEHQLARVEEAAAANGLTIVRRRAIELKEGEPALLSLFLMMRAEDLPEEMREQTWVEPPLVIRREDGSVHPEYAAVKLSFGFPP
jgi:tRNA1(Val) A37 N6-methylase TrmN6